MDQRPRPAPRLATLPPEHTPELKEQFEVTRKRMGYLGRRKNGSTRAASLLPRHWGSEA
jgi:hypothetical protein